jgi:3-oxoacyl-[acyl-carrier protein] reductase
MRKCALVTGASRGLGRAIAVELAKELGLHILINFASNEKAALETKELVEAAKGTAELMRFRVENSDQVESTLGNWLVENKDSRIEVLVNNAGIHHDNLMVFMEESQFDDVLNVNLKGMFNVTRFLLKQMVHNRYGRIINMASLSGLKGVPGQVNYSAAKGGMIAATKSLAQEIAKRNITVNAIAPGFIATDMTKNMDEEMLKKLVPMGRFGKPEEVAELVSFIASDKATYITGQVISIDGGIS